MTPPTLPAGVARQSARLMRRLVFNQGLPWEDQRRRLGRAAGSGSIPDGLELSTDVVAGVPVEVLTPSGHAPVGTLVHFHGGGFTVGTPALGRGWAGALALRLGLEVILPDYRLAPEHTFPAAHDDAVGVVGDVLRRFDPASVAVSGDSAGGCLALAAAQARVADGGTVPGTIVLLSPWLDLTVDRLADLALVRRDPLLSPEWLAAAATAYAAGQLEDPRVSPLLGSLAGLPPVLIQGGTDDILAPDAARLAAALGDRATLSIGPGMWHDFSLQVGMLAAADRALEVVVGHLAATLALAGD